MSRVVAFNSPLAPTAGTSSSLWPCFPPACDGDDKTHLVLSRAGAHVLEAVQSASYSLTHLTNSAAYEVGTIVIIPILHMGSLRLTEESILPQVTEAST